MSPAAFVRDLRLHLRAWERHHVRFGVVCSRHRLTMCQPVFSTACIGISAADLHRVNHSEPGVALSVAVTDEALVYRFPYGHPRSRWRGKRNPGFLKGRRMVKALCAFDVPVETVILPLAEIYRTEEITMSTLAGPLQTFFNSLPETLRYALEVRNGEYLLPEYFDLLALNNIAHVINDSPGMPSLLDQIQIPRVLTADHVIVRSTASDTPEWKLGILETVRRCVSEKKHLSVHLSDGEILSVESAIAGLIELLQPDLAKLSPLRRKAA